MQAIERIKAVMAEYESANGVQEEQKALNRMDLMSGPSLFKEVIAHIDNLEAKVERLRKDAESWQQLQRDRTKQYAELLAEINKGTP